MDSGRRAEGKTKARDMVTVLCTLQGHVALHDPNRKGQINEQHRCSRPTPAEILTCAHMDHTARVNSGLSPKSSRTRTEVHGHIVRHAFLSVLGPNILSFLYVDRSLDTSPAAKKLLYALERVASTHQLAREINQRVHTKYDSTNPTHERKLRLVRG